MSHDPIVLLSAGLLLALAGHDASHALDGGLETSLDQLALVAVPQWLVLAVVMAVIVRGDRALRRVAALLLGTGAAVGFTAIHLLPFATASYWDVEPSLVSWLLAWLPAALGVALAARAWGEAPATSEWSRPAAPAAHPDR